MTRPDLAHPVQQVCLHMHDPRLSHLALLKRVLRYVRGTTSFGIELHASPSVEVRAYSDADWPAARIPDDQHLGFVSILVIH